MATTYTEHLQIPKHDPADPFNIALINEGFDKTEAGILAAYRGMAAYNLLDNSYFPEAINQRGKTATTAWQYCLDRWVARSGGITLHNDKQGIHLNSDENAYVFIYQKVKTPSVDMLGKTYTIVMCDGAGVVKTNVIKLPTTHPAAWTNYTGVTIGNANCHMFYTGSGDNGFCVAVGRVNNVTDEAVIKWVKLFEGEYSDETYPDDKPREYVTELLECQRYFHLYASENARPSHGLDCVPHMRLNNPTQGTIVIDGVTYYYNAADL